MIGSVQMEALLRITKTLGVACVVLTGDTKQLRAVDAGQPFRFLQKAGMATARMDEVLRQRDPGLLAAVTAAREGDPGGAISGLGNRVREAPPDQLGRTAAKRWLALPQLERERTAVLAPTHLIRGDINHTVREGLLDEGVLHGEALMIERLINQRLTRVEAADPNSYQPGDVVVFHRDAYGCAAHDTCTVNSVDGGEVELAHPDGKPRRFRPSGNAARNLGLYDTSEIEIRAGDRIRWTRNRKAPPARFGWEPAPDLINGEQATVVEIDRRRVRFRRDDGRTYLITRDEPQLRHIDHAYSTTVHGAQGLTSPRVIAVLEAGGRADQDLLYVEISRASEGFELVVDDRERLADRLAERPGIDEGALEAIGADLAAPVVDPELFAGLQADWRSLRRRADEEGRVPYLADGYGEVVAQIAALGVIEDLPADMRGFVDTVLEEHTAHQQRDGEIRGLAESLGSHWRQWPELCWKASSLGVAPEALDEHRQWRGEGDRLMAQARNLLEDRGEDGRHLSAMEGVRSGLESSLVQIEKVRTADDLARKMEDRGSHIEALRVNHDALRRPSGEIASTVRWHRHEPLVPGDRVRWTNTSGAEPQESRHPEQTVGNMMRLHHQYQEALRRGQFLYPDDEQETAGNAAETERLRNETAHIVRKVLEDPKHYKAALKRADVAMFEVRSIARDIGVTDWKKNLGRGGLEM